MHRFSNLSPEDFSHLEIIRKLKILNSPYETLFNTITRATSEVFNAPIALISFIEEDRYWFKPNIGLDEHEHLPIELAFCMHTINSEGIFVVNDASIDELFKNNPLVIGKPNIRFFVGAPISLPLGEKIGSLCVIDSKPNQLNDYKVAALEGFAKIISNALLIHDIHTKTAIGKSPLETILKRKLVN